MHLPESDTGNRPKWIPRNLLMDLGEQADRVKFMIRDGGRNFTAAFDTVRADAGIRTVLCNIQTPRMNAITERWIGGCRRELAGPQPRLEPGPSSANPARLRGPPQSAPVTPLASGAAPLKPLPEPVDLARYRVRRQARVGGLINEYHRSHDVDGGFGHAQVMSRTSGMPLALAPGRHVQAGWCLE